MNLFVVEADRLLRIIDHNFPFAWGHRWRVLLIDKCQERAADLSHKSVDPRYIFSSVWRIVCLKEAGSQGLHIL